MAKSKGFRKFVSPEIVFGNGSRKLIGRYAQQFQATRVLVVSDEGVINAGWTKDVADSLVNAGLEYELFTHISPNPRSEEVMEGAEIFRSKKCDLIVSVGGGSPMDCAKGIGIVGSNGGHVNDYEGVDKIQYPIPPLLFIPTTAGTSADVSQFCIISRQDILVKIAIISKALVPDLALIDPEVCLSMDNYLTACTGMDALVHAIEAYVSAGAGPLTDLYAREAVSLLNGHLLDVIKDPANILLREKIMLASMQAGMAFSNASLGAVHAMAHSLGGMLDLPHGECNSLLLEHVVRFNYPYAENRYRELLDIFMPDWKQTQTKSSPKDILADYISAFRAKLQIDKGLEYRGVGASDIPMLAGKAIKDACMLTNPRKAGKEDLEAVFREAL
jgi:alcohol dehydrogenase class IV